MINNIIEKGDLKKYRNDSATKTIFGGMMRYDLG
jgi:hypothetical protein